MELAEERIPLSIVYGPKARLSKEDQKTKVIDHRAAGRHKDIDGKR
jgi:hypothetical protein